MCTMWGPTTWGRPPKRDPLHAEPWHLRDAARTAAAQRLHLHRRGRLAVRSNFQDQYFQSEFDRGKDIESLVYLKQQQSNWAWTAIIKPNDQPFEYETQWLPRGDLYVLSQPLQRTDDLQPAHLGRLCRGAPRRSAQLAGSLHAHLQPRSRARGRLIHASAGDAPFNLGPVNVVPHAMGEAAYRGDSFDGEPVSLIGGQPGIEIQCGDVAGLPEVQSDIFNLNGLAHKIVFETDYEYTTVNRSMSDIAQWNELDDNAQERFQERLVQNTSAACSRCRSTIGCTPSARGPDCRSPRPTTNSSTTSSS